VDATIGNKSGLKFMIDTGATHTVVDAKVLRKLGLRPESGAATMVSFGKTVKTRSYLIADLRIARMRTSLYCLEGSLANLGFDGILGLDVLRCRNYLAHCETGEHLSEKILSIDFAAQRMAFGASEPLDHEAPFENDPYRIIVTALIQGRPARMLVDTGAALTMLSNRGSPDWMRDLPVVGIGATFDMLAQRRQRAVQLPILEIGDDRWTNLHALIVDAGNSATDGVLAVSHLGIKTVRFDFMRMLMAWR